MSPDRPGHYRAAYRGAALTILAHVLVLYAAFTVLAVVFQFPDILRQPATARLDLFQQRQGVVRPIYWALTLSGFTQVAIALFLFQSFRDRGRPAVVFAAVFGTLAGVLQALGYVRWVTLTPYLARAMADSTLPDVTRQAIALAEGSFNRYAGMGVGEHAGGLALGVWTLCFGLAMRGDPLFDRRLGTAGVALAPLAFLVALEPLGVAPRLLGAVIAVAFPAWVVWLVVTATSLWRANAGTGEGPRLTWRTAAWAGLLYVMLAVPGFL